MPASPVSATNFPCRRFAVGSLVVQLSADNASVVERFDRLFGAFPTASDRPVDVDVVITGHAGALPELFDAMADGEVLVQSMSLGDVEFRVSRLLNDRKLDAEADLLHLHSSAVACAEDAVLLVARSGAGKSSLAAALVRSGWDYVTDEMVAIGPDDFRVRPYPRPITLRRGVWRHFPGLAPFPDTDMPEDDGARVEVPPQDLGSVSLVESTPLAVVLPRYVEAGAVRCEPVESRAEAVRLITQCCYDLERLGVAGFEALVDLAARAPVWHLDYHDLGEGVAAVDRLAEAARSAESTPVEHLVPPGEVVLPPGTFGRAGDAHSWSFEDGSTVVFRPSGLAVARLDPAGSQLWHLLSEPSTVDDLAATVGAVDGEPRTSLQWWLDAMVKSGFVVGPGSLDRQDSMSRN